MNILPMLVLTDLLYCGLNQIMLRFLFFLFECFLLVVDAVAWFHVHCFLEIFNSKCLKNFFDDDKIESLFTIDRGISLMIDRGWSGLT